MAWVDCCMPNLAVIGEGMDTGVDKQSLVRIMGFWQFSSHKMKFHREEDTIGTSNFHRVCEGGRSPKS